VNPRRMTLPTGNGYASEANSSPIERKVFFVAFMISATWLHFQRTSIHPLPFSSVVLLFCWLISRYAKPICFVAAGTCMSISYPVLSLFTFLHFLHLTDFYLDPRFPGRRAESLCKQYAFTFHLNYFLLSILCWA
jgi:hypothetical protein